MNMRALPLLAAPLAVSFALVTASCVSPSSTGSATATTAPTSTFSPTTSLMPDCGPMPDGEELSEVVGVPLDDGAVTGAGLCQFTGVNDQSAAVLLQWLTDPGDRQSFLDLQASLGEPRPLRVTGITDGFVGPDGTVWVDRDGVVYSVWVSVTGEPASEQTPEAAAVLARWLTD